MADKGETTYARRKRQGLCVHCGAAAATCGRVSCGSCRKEIRIITAAVRQAFTQEGICIYCQRAPASGDRRGCASCLGAIAGKISLRRARIKDERSGASSANTGRPYAG